MPCPAELDHALLCSGNRRFARLAVTSPIAQDRRCLLYASFMWSRSGTQSVPSPRSELRGRPCAAAGERQHTPPTHRREPRRRLLSPVCRPEMPCPMCRWTSWWAERSRRWAGGEGASSEPACFVHPPLGHGRPSPPPLRPLHRLVPSRSPSRICSPARRACCSACPAPTPRAAARCV